MKAICILAVGLSVSVFGQEWTRFRGPNGTGISQEKTIPTHLSDANLTWKVELPGVGHSSPVLWGEKIFLTTTDDRGGISALCVEAKDGRTIWRNDFPLKPFEKHKFNTFASSTPAVDSERVYIHYTEPGRYMLAALDHAGRVLWERDFGPYYSQHGSGTSPIVHDGMVIIGNEQGDSNPKAKSFIVAVDAKDGKTVWQTERESSSAAYSTPCLYAKDGEKDGAAALIFNSEGHGIYAVNPANGKVLWDYKNAFDKRSVSSPVVAGDIIFGSCGSGGGGSFVTAIKAGDVLKGAVPTLAYTIKKSAPYVPTPVARDGLAWLWSDGGILTCIDSATGEIRYQERVGGDFFGSPIWVDGRLYAVSTSGEVIVVEASDTFKILHRYPLNELCRTTPAVALGKMFIRTENHLWCFGGVKTPPRS